MKTQELQHSIEKFEIQRQRDEEHFKNLEALQQDFVNDFPIKKIRSLSLDEYIEGKGSHTSFCYRLERQLDTIGNMRGSTVAVFVVYYSKDKSKYLYTKKLGVCEDEYDALEKVKLEIVNLIKAGRSKDTDTILKNRLADLFKYKILGTYYPDEFPNLYSHIHLDYFIGELGLNPEGKTILDKQNTLVEFKNSDEIMKAWTNFEFNGFLYSTFGRPPSNEEQKEQQSALPAIDKVKPEVIDLTIIENKYSRKTKSKGSGKLNYKEQQERNNRLGKRGENIVYNLEKEFFKKNKLPLKKLIHSSLKDDRLGYDIQSLDAEGNIKYIEVKATRRAKGDTSFLITDNEKEQAENLENYFIYVVFEAHTLRPKIWQINEPFKRHKKDLKLSPVNYRVEVKVND